MARKIFMSAYNEYSQPTDEVLDVNGISFDYDKPFFLICNFPIQDNAYFEIVIDDYYPIKAFKEIPIYLGISKEASFGVLNSDFIIGAIYSKNTENYDIMSKYSRQYLNTHAHPSSIHTRVPGAHDVIGLGVDYTNNCINIFVNGKFFYAIENKTYDEDGNVLTEFDLSTQIFYFCLWSNVYYKKVLTDYNEDSGDKALEESKRIKGHVYFGGPNASSYKPDGYEWIGAMYESHIDPPDPEDTEEDPSDSSPEDDSRWEGYDREITYVGYNPDNSSEHYSDNCRVTIKNDAFDPSVETMALTTINTDRVEIIDKYRYTMEATEDPDEEYFKSGSSIFINKPIPTTTKVYFEFYVEEGEIKDGKIGIPISVGISKNLNAIVEHSSRMELFHKQWYHFFWDEMRNTSAYSEEWKQSIHEIDDVFTSVTPEQGQVIGVALNLKKNKFTVYVNNTKLYTVFTNIAVDRDTGEHFTIAKTSGGLLRLTGKNGTTYTETTAGHFTCSNGIQYTGYYHESLGRYDLREVGAVLEFVLEGENLYSYNGEMYDLTTKDSYYLVFTGRTSGEVYTQVKSDVIQRHSDNLYFEMYLDEATGNYTFIKVHSDKQIVISELDYSKAYEFTYAFIHDDGAFDGMVKGKFNFGQDPFVATIPEGYISLWDYYNIITQILDVKDLSCRVRIVNNNEITNSIPSQIKIINSGQNATYPNDGLNKLILDHTTISNTEAKYFDTSNVDIPEFITMIARENNGYIPEEKQNPISISFEGMIHYTVTIEQTDINQTIEVVLNGKQKYTTTFNAPKGAIIETRVVPNKGYTAGTPSVSKITVVEDTIVTASPATLTPYIVSIEPTEHQYIKVYHVISRNPDGSMDEYKVYDNRNGGTSFNVTVESNEIEVEVCSLDFGYNIGKANYKVLRVTGDTTITATPATRKTFTITIPNTTHQLVNVRIGQAVYEANKVEPGEHKDPIIVQAAYGDVAYIESVSVDLGWKLVTEDYVSYMVIDKDNMIIPIPEIEDDMCTITVNADNFDGQYSISPAILVSHGFSIRRGTEVTIRVEPDDGLYVDTFTLE